MEHRVNSPWLKPNLQRRLPVVQHYTQLVKQLGARTIARLIQDFQCLLVAF
jgi:hypothetical protein